MINRLFCPLCGREMSADIHTKKDFPDMKNPSEMDIWVCLNEDCIFILLDRDDLKYIL